MVQTPSANDTFFGLDISDTKKSFFSFRRKISKRYLLIEFGIDSLTYGEARVVKDQVFYSKINRIALDKSAIERGTPTDTQSMASFLTQIIEEDQIWAHRVGITLPPQAAISRIIYLPEHLNYQEAIEYVSNPSSSGFQFPISIENTDFDIIPLNNITRKNKKKAYFLNSVPKKLIDNVIKTLSEANLELHTLDISYSSLQRIANTSINQPIKDQVLVLIELSLECTHFYIIGLNGPIYVSSLAAIKAFEVKDNYEGDQSIEEYTINSEDYLEISEIDLKILFSEINNELDQFKKEFNLEICEIILSGVNSSHPGIKELFKNRFNINTSILRSKSSKYIGNINLSKPIVMQDLNRLIGLGLSMVESEKISTADLDDNLQITKKEMNINENKKDLKTQKKHTSDLQDKKKATNEKDSMNELVTKKSEFKIEDSKTQNISFDEFLKQNDEDSKSKDNKSNLILKSNNISNNSIPINVDEKDISIPGFDKDLKNTTSEQISKNNTENNNMIDDELNLKSSEKTSQNKDSFLDFDTDLKNTTSDQISKNNTENNNMIDDELNLKSSEKTSQNKDSFLDFDTDLKNTTSDQISKNNTENNYMIDDELNLKSSEKTSQNKDSFLDFDTDLKNTTSEQISKNNTENNNMIDDELNLKSSEKTSQNKDSFLDFDTDLENTTSEQESKNKDTIEKYSSQEKASKDIKENNDFGDDFNMPKN